MNNYYLKISTDKYLPILMHNREDFRNFNKNSIPFQIIVSIE